MKDQCLALAQSAPDSLGRMNIMREYLQAYLLRLLHQQKFFRTHAFLGGTALRFIYNLPRYSEDLDFSAIDSKAGPMAQPIADLMRKIKTDLEASGYQIEIKLKTHGAVHSALIKFSQLLLESGLTHRKDHNLSIKIEADLNPPLGATLETPVLNKFFPLTFAAHDRPSLFAGKMAAVLTRPYTKGRDFFDLGWYLSKWSDLIPNFILLQNALTQSGWRGELLTPDNWRSLILNKVAQTNWLRVTQDVTPFLENPLDLEILNQAHLTQLLQP